MGDGLHLGDGPHLDDALHLGDDLPRRPAVSGYSIGTSRPSSEER